MRNIFSPEKSKNLSVTLYLLTMMSLVNILLTTAIYLQKCYINTEEKSLIYKKSQDSECTLGIKLIYFTL